MKRRSAIIIAILILAVGFAAISTTLIINGTTKVSENVDDFSIIFTKATLDGTDVYNEVLDDTKKIINFSTSDLKTLNQTSVLNYEITNNSANYDAEVSVNCKIKDNAEAKYTSIKNELEGNATKVLAKETLNGTLTITLNKVPTEEVKEEYVCTLEFNAIERDELGIESVSFNDDSWELISKNVKSRKTDKYSVGDTKDVDLGELGTHTLRISNMSACTTETSETACGFVVEFTDIITKQKFNNTETNVGGWKNSQLRTYINETIFTLLPSELQNVIVDTKVISGHGSTSGEVNFETQDKLYLLSAKEIYGSKYTYDLIDAETKQLDYYKDQGVTSSGSTLTIKQYDGSNLGWWLRSACSANNRVFTISYTNGSPYTNGASNTSGVSPAFRIA